MFYCLLWYQDGATENQQTMQLVSLIHTVLKISVKLQNSAHSIYIYIYIWLLTADTVLSMSVLVALCIEYDLLNQMHQEKISMVVGCTHFVVTCIKSDYVQGNSAVEAVVTNQGLHQRQRMQNMMI